MLQQPVKILVLEDDDFDYDLLERQLKGLDFSYRLNRSKNQSEFIEKLSDFSPELILSDFSIPGFSGLEALKIVTATETPTPFIFVSGTIGEELAVESLKQGAVDYVLKENMNKLIPAVNRALKEAEEKNKREKAEEKLRVKVKELNTLVYRISHDIKGPICTMRGALNLFRDLKDTNFEESCKCVDLIGNVTDNMNLIIQNLSNFRFLNKDEVQYSKIDIEEFLEEIKESISQIDGYSKVHCEFNYSKEVKELYFERNFLSLITFNLIHNSIIFADPSKDRQVISFYITIRDNNIEIHVQDNGTGIATSVRDRIFDMFFRGSNASRGAGLGLYLVKSTVDELGGNINVESTEGEGTSVTVKLPVHDQVLTEEVKQTK